MAGEHLIAECLKTFIIVTEGFFFRAFNFVSVFQDTVFQVGINYILTPNFEQPENANSKCVVINPSIKTII